MSSNSESPHYLYRSLGADEHGERFMPTLATGSPWGLHLQHAGPVTALLARQMEALINADGATPNRRITTLTLDILGPVPRDEVTVRAQIHRPGRKIELLGAEMSATVDGVERVVARAQAWVLRTFDTSAERHVVDEPLGGQPTATTQVGSPGHLLPELWQVGFVQAVDWHLLSPMGEKGAPTAAWLKLGPDLIDGEPTSPFLQAMAIADIANGIGARLDPAAWIFMNTELTVHLFEPPTEEWVGLSAETSVGSDGVAMGSGVLHDSRGPIGRVVQNVLMEPIPRD